ncbi:MULTISPECIES: hypothetical protein [Pseudomonas]|nr:MULTISPECIES: hypothetical protein [Pseudomonas]
MTLRPWIATALGAAGLSLLALIFWGWHQGGLAIMQLGMSLC